MATVNRPPFWVPKPPDDNIWYYQPLHSQSLVLATTELKWYGAPGQVPTKRWLPYYTLNDPPEWQGAPIHSQSLVLATTELKWYGAPGQVPTKRWLSQYTHDDPPPWSPTAGNLVSAVINLLTHQTVFGAGGQVPTKLWSSYLWDDPSPVWQFPTDWMNSAALQQLTSQKIFGQGGQVPPSRWNFNYDETGPWQWTLQERNPNLLTVSAAQNTFTPVLWRFNYDETPVWSGSPIASNIEFIPQNVPRAAFYALKPGEEYYWQPAVQRNINLFPAAAVQNPFLPVFWRYNYDDATPVEFWKPYATNTTFTLSSFVEYAPRNNWQEWFDTIDDPPTWQWAYHRNLNINTGTTTAVPVVPQIWPFRTYPDDVGWIGQPVAANINFIPSNVPRAAFWALRAGFDTEWVGTPLRVSMSMNPPLPPPVVTAVYNTLLLSIPGGMFSIPGDPPS